MDRIKITRALINTRCRFKGLLLNVIIQTRDLDTDSMIIAGLSGVSDSSRQTVGVQRKNCEENKVEQCQKHSSCSDVPRLGHTAAQSLMN